MSIVKKILITCALLSTQTISPIVILIHGTFAAGGGWSRPGGKFYNILEREIQKYNHKLVPFAWTGGATHKDRLQGAQALAKVILSYPENEEKIVVGHSHAGNVIALASHLLSDPVGRIMKNIDPKKILQELIDFVNKQYEILFKNDQEPTKAQESKEEKRKNEWENKNLILTTYLNAHFQKESFQNKNDQEPTKGLSNDNFLIKRAYLIATPIDTESYMPDMSVIDTLFNLYSKGDIVQPVFGFYNRLFPECDRIANFRVTIEDSGIFGDDPSHSEMHDPVVAQWLLDIPYELKETQTNGFENYEDFHNGKIYFNSNGYPFFKIDKKTTEEREVKEKSRMQKIIDSISSYF